nr:unnamed protein product [Digitaria exilis]
MAEIAAVGWAISTLGWFASPLATRLVNDGLALLGLDESEKLRDLEARLLPQLALMREQAERIPPEQRDRVKLWANSLRDAFYEAEDILDIADYHRLHNQKMLEAASVEPSPAFNNLDTLQKKLVDELEGKRFFLVLDDIWAVKHESVQFKLDQLLSPLADGKEGSMVLVTTRFKEAAADVGVQNPMKIPDLKEMDFFNLFMHYALNGATLDAKELDTFQTIGKQITKKLKGSPLAARVVGARLRKKLEATFWRRVEDQVMLPDTMGALWWSYQHLNEQGIPIEEIEGMLTNLKKLRVVQVHLPKNLGSLYHLQILELHGSGFPGLGELKSLRELSDFRVSKEKGYELQQLKGINNLRGRLRISGLDCVESKEVAREARLCDKKHLTGLSLEWSRASVGQQILSPDLQVEILEGLCPPSQLTDLQISGYCGRTSIRSLPPLPACLQTFELTDCDPSFMKSCQKPGDPNWNVIAHIPSRRFVDTQN